MKQWKAIQDTSIRLLGKLILTLFCNINVTVSRPVKQLYTLFYSVFCLFVCFSVRFFVVEDHILHATQGLVTRAYTDELWNMALSKIIAVLRTHSVGTHSHSLLYCLYFDLIAFIDIKYSISQSIRYPHNKMPNLFLTNF